MREIKFRAWDKKEGKWLLGYELPNLGGFSMFGEIMLMGEYTALLSSRFPNDIKTIALMQFTGLKDRNGKEVYENDIILFPKEVTTAPQEVLNGAREGRPWSLRTRNARGWWGDPKSWEGIEVIGNIYENSELLSV